MKSTSISKFTLIEIKRNLKNWIIIFTLALTSFEASAVETLFSNNCGDFTKAENDNLTAYQLWILGFLSGSAYQTNVDILKGQSIEKITEAMKNICKSNPKEHLASAVDKLYESLKSSIDKTNARNTSNTDAKGADGGQIATASVNQKSRVKSCNQFVQELTAHKDRLPSINHSLDCQITNDKDKIFKITISFPGRNLAPHIYEYNQTDDSVLYTKQSGQQDKLRGKTFVSYSEAADMNAEGNILMNNLPKNQRIAVCKKINSATSPVGWHTFDLAAGYELVQIARNKGWSFDARSSGDICIMDILIEGIYKGSQYSSTVSCEIRAVEKKPDGNYSVRQLAVGGGSDYGCRRN